MSGPDRRSTERLLLTIPIRVIGFGKGDRSFSEDTHTIEVNREGARIVLRHRVIPDETLRIINLENFREADFRVVGQTRLESLGIAEWGVECLETGRNIWGIDFPPPVASEGSQAGALIECGGCGRQSLCALAIVEVAMLDSAGALQRLCDHCGQFTSWTYADAARRSQDSRPSEQVIPPRVQEWDGKSERRAHRRLTLKLPVLVRNHKGEQEIAKTENISKGGLAVSLSMNLHLGEIVTVVCPYTEGGQDLSQRAEVRRRITLTADRRWLYGFRYIP